jgi:Tol biopolymer transport system component
VSGQIFFPVFDQDRQTFDIHVVDLGSAVRQVVVEQASQPALSPSGQRLAYRFWDRGSRGIWGLELSQGNSWPWTDLDQAARPSWSPDSQDIVVASRHEPGGQWRLYRSDTGFASLPRESGDSYGSTPVWLAGDRIVHAACTPAGCGLYIMRSNGSNLERLTTGKNDIAPAASPDGSQIAFVSDRDGNWEIYVINTDGTGLRRLTNNASRDGLPTWSPDGQWLAFVTNREGNWSVWAMRPDGSEQQKLFSLGGSLEGKIAYVPDDQQQGWTWEAIAWGP